MHGKIARSSTVCLLTMVGLCCSLSLASAQGRRAGGRGPAAAAAADAGMLGADMALVQALDKGDRTAVANLLDEEVTWTDVTGKTLAKADVAKAVPKPAIADENTAEIARYEYDRVGIIQVNGNRLHALRVWVKRPAGWRMLVYQEVRPLASAVTAVTAGAGKNCENPCGAVPYEPQSESERAVIAAYRALESAVEERDGAGFAAHVAEEFVAVSSNGDRMFDKETRRAAIERSTLGGVSPTRLLTARLFEFGSTVVMRSQHRSNSGDLLQITRVWVKREGNWVETLSYQTLVAPTS